jgi:membrane protease YdiL (CAAX protease family)
MSTPFHRLARETPQHAWWKLPLAGLIAVFGYVGVTIALVVGVMIALFAAGHDGGEIITRWLDSSDQLELQEPGFFALSMIGVALMLPVILLAVLIAGPRPIGFLTSVEGRMRWGWLGRMIVLAFVVYGLALAVTLTVSEAVEPGDVSAPRVDGTVITVLVLVLVLVLTPFQAAAEEYVFRGYLLQLVGSWTRFAFIPILVSVPIFAAGHTYNLWGLVDVGIFGLTAAYLTIRTGGLEAGIAAHIANNVVLMVVDALGMITSTGEGGPVDLIPTVVTSVVMVGLVSRLATRQGIARTRPPIEPPPPPPAPMWPPPPYAMIWWPPPAYVPPPAWPPPYPPPGPPEVNRPAYPGEVPPDRGS